MARINIIGLGGAGTNVGGDVLNHLRDNCDFEEVHGYRLYSSDDENTPVGFDDSYRFRDGGINGEELKGSGGDRKSNVPAYVEGIREFLNESKVFKQLEKATHNKAVNVLLFSGSKGTGSTAGPILMKMLTEKNIPFVTFMVTDNADELSIINNVNTLRTIVNISKQSRSNPLIYIGENNRLVGKEVSEQEVNDDICTVVETICVMGVGKVNDLDEADTTSFIDIKRYHDLNTPASPMVLKVLDKDEYGNFIPVEGLTTVLARTITTSPDSKVSKVKAKHNPKGWISQDKVNFELDTIITSNIGIQKYLTNLEDAYEENSVKVEVKPIESKLDKLVKANVVTTNYQEEKELELISNPTYEESKSKDDEDDDGWVTGFLI